VAGTFQVDGTLTTSTSKVTVNSGAALTGSGTINRPTEIAGTILPGTGAGTGALSLGAALTWDAGSKYAFTYSAVTGLNPGVNYATINSSSTLNLSAVTPTNPVTIAITPVNSPGTTGGPVTYTLGGFSNGGSSGGIVGFNPADFAFAGSFSGTPSVSVDPTQNTLLLTFTPALLAPTTWTGNASGSWNNSANWSPTAVPASGPNTQLVFGPSANSAMTNDIPGTFTVNSLTFNAGSPVYGLSGNGLNFVTNGAGGGPQIVTNSANGVTVSAALTLTNNLTVSGAGNLALSGAIGGIGSLTMNGSGTVTFGNSGNSYSGGTAVLNGTVQVAADASLGSGNVTGAALGTVNFTATTATTKSFTMNGGTIAVAATKTVTFNGGQVAGAFLDGAGTIANNGAQFVNVTATPSVAVVSTNAADRFVHFDNSASLTVAVGVNTTGASTVVNLNGFTNQGLGSVTVGAGSRINVGNVQSFGTVTLNPATIAGQITLVTNLGNSPLAFTAGSRTLVGTPATATASPAVTGVDIHGQNLIISGGLFVNNGFVADSTASPGSVIVDYGALYKGAGTTFVPVVTQNGGRVQAGNSPGSMAVGRFVFGPGGVNNYVFAINDATGTAGPSPDAQGLVSGWGLVKAVKQQFGATTTNGDFFWTATPSNKLTFALDTLVNPTTVGTDVSGPMANFDPAQSYAWPAVHWDGTYSGPTDAASLTVSTAFDTSGFANAVAGTFGWNLDPAGQTLSLTYTPIAVPEPGTLALASVAAIGWVTFWRRRWQPNGPSATLSA
jgi:fibronectin-binding autotransporter adhesin